ncbi:MAG: 3,5-nucleoside bisphosphate phosphatase [Actinomycetota bacterium]|jgi:predicted metal-dependent phosphoesterase TrpH|nr:3,5-nucleoside bisphosphate phosphatase [Actinomycetota bacterium]
MRIDLHTHSTASDGTQPPAEVVGSAAEAGLDVLALTDHDTTSGWAEAVAAAVRLGIGLVRGIEISCQHRGISIHLLGYLPDPASQGLRAELERSRESRGTRAQRIVGLLSKDVELDWDDVRRQIEPGATIGRPHIADALVAKGIVPSREAAFADYLYNGSPYYASHHAPEPVQAVRLVKEAGGVTVMAHPFARNRGRVVDDSLIEAMSDAGMSGLEVRHRDHNQDQLRHGLELASSLELFVTGSSDYHGAGKPNLLGENTTDPEVLQQIEELATGVEVVRP